MSKKKIIIIAIISAVIVIGGVIGVLFLNHNKKLESNNSISVADNSDINDSDKKETEENKKDETTADNKTTDSEEIITDTEDNKKTDNSDNKKENTDDNSEKTSTSDDIRNGDVTVTDERQSTTQSTTQTTTESTTVAPEPTHNHSYSPTYGTINAQQYASDGTTNDYNKPIYGTQQVEKTRKVPVYETHKFDINGNDATANWNNYGRAEWQASGYWSSENSDNFNFKAWLTHTVGSDATSPQQVQVGTTTETYYETEEVVTGYEQLGTTTKKTITGYTCNCGKSISAATYVSQYGTPSGYYLDGEILVHN